MNPENKPEAVNVETGGATTPPSPICYREYDKPCGCEKCEEFLEAQHERMKDTGKE